MTVKELIERLSTEDPNMRVVVDGYESGYDETKDIMYVNVVPNRHRKVSKKDDIWWEGELEYSNSTNDEKVILLPRKS
jgi:hypothetical protein